jgi:uncharacterized protein YueI
MIFPQINANKRKCILGSYAARQVLCLINGERRTGKQRADKQLTISALNNNNYLRSFAFICGK